MLRRTLACLAAASLGLARSEANITNITSNITSASRICVENKGGFVLSFDLWNTATNVLSRRSRGKN